MVRLLNYSWSTVKIIYMEKKKVSRASPVGEGDPAPVETMLWAAHEAHDAVDDCRVDALAAKPVDQLVVV